MLPQGYGLVTPPFGATYRRYFDSDRESIKELTLYKVNIKEEGAVSWSGSSVTDTHTHVHTTHTFTNSHPSTHTRIHTHVPTRVYTRTRTHTHTCTCPRVQTYIPPRTYVHTCRPTYTHVRPPCTTHPRGHTHTRAHTRTHTNTGTYTVIECRLRICCVGNVTYMHLFVRKSTVSSGGTTTKTTLTPQSWSPWSSRSCRFSTRAVKAFLPHSRGTFLDGEQGVHLTSSTWEVVETSLREGF